MAEVPAQRRMKSNLQNKMQAILDQVKQITDTYHFNVGGEMTSSGTAFSEDLRSICEKSAKGLDSLQLDVSRSGEGSLSQRASGGNYF